MAYKGRLRIHNVSTHDNLADLMINARTLGQQVQVALAAEHVTTADLRQIMNR